jgi:hypothetical protein
MFSPSNTNSPRHCGSAIQADIKILEQERDRVLQLTNYLEALYARLLSETAGSTALTPIADERQSTPIQTL